MCFHLSPTKPDLTWFSLDCLPFAELSKNVHLYSTHTLVSPNALQKQDNCQVDRSHINGTGILKTFMGSCVLYYKYTNSSELAVGEEQKNKPHSQEQCVRGYSGGADDIPQCTMGENSVRENEQVLKSATWS